MTEILKTSNVPDGDVTFKSRSDGKIVIEKENTIVLGPFSQDVLNDFMREHRRAMDRLEEAESGEE